MLAVLRWGGVGDSDERKGATVLEARDCNGSCESAGSNRTSGEGEQACYHAFNAKRLSCLGQDLTWRPKR